MAGSPLRKYILTPILLSASVFAVFSMPLAIFGSESMTIKVQNEPLFHGQLRHAAPPYLGLVTLLSLGTGGICTALTGWGDSNRNSEKVKEQISNLSQSLQEKETQLKELKLSQSKLDVSGLKDFLNREIVREQNYQPKVIREAIPTLVEAPVNEPEPIKYQSVKEPNLNTLAEPVRQFASAQNFLGHAQKTSTLENYPEVETLNSQLQQIMAQMASLQQAMQGKSLRLSEAKNYEQQNSQQPKLVQSWSIHESTH